MPVLIASGDKLGNEKIMNQMNGRGAIMRLMNKFGRAEMSIFWCVPEMVNLA